MYRAAIVNREPVILDMDNKPTKALSIEDARFLARMENLHLQEEIEEVYEAISKCRGDLIYNANPWPYGVETPDRELIDTYNAIQEATTKLDEAKEALWLYQGKLSWEITTK